MIIDASSITRLFFDSGFIDNIAELIIVARSNSRNFRVRRCSRFYSERFNALLDTPCIVCTMQRSSPKYVVEKMGAMREMAGLEELRWLQDLASKIRKSQPKDPSEIAVSKMPPFDKIAEPQIATLRVAVKHNRKKDHVIVWNNMGGFSDEACGHLKNDVLFPMMKRFARASGADTAGTVFR